MGEEDELKARLAELDRQKKALLAEMLYDEAIEYFEKVNKPIK